MSVLTKRDILIVGDVTTQLTNLEETLHAHGTTVHRLSCQNFTTELIKKHKAELIVVNYTHGHSDVACNDTLLLIKDFFTENAIPVFAVVDDNPEIIQEVLAYGVADYITPDEDIASIIAKIKAVFGEGDVFDSASAIDITPHEAEISATGIRVYVVEDDPLLRNLLSMKMDKSQFPYEFSNDGQGVIPAMRQFRPDVVILDLMLPGRSGFDVLTEIKADEQLSEVPVIVFSNKDTDEDKERAKNLGARGFYVKAMTDLSELIETIEALVK